MVQLTPTAVPVGSVPEGKVTDFLTGKFVNDTPEEYVRQNLEKALVRQYKYKPSDCEPEFTIKVGSSRKRADIVVFKPGSDHVQGDIYILVETKKADVKATSRTEGIGQLHSYMAACLNAQYGMWTNGDDRFCYAKRDDGDWPVRGGRRPARRADHDDFRFPATNVLFGAVLADTLLRIAEAGAYRPHWSPDVLAELSRNWVLRAREERIEGRRFRT